MAGAAAYMASTYEEYIGEILGPLKWITKFKIPHPGKLLGRFILKYSMPLVMDWVLGGSIGALDNVLEVRNEDGVTKRSRVEKYPDIDLENFNRLLKDDDYLIRTANADWLLVE